MPRAFRTGRGERIEQQSRYGWMEGVNRPDGLGEGGDLVLVQADQRAVDGQGHVRADRPQVVQGLAGDLAEAVAGDQAEARSRKARRGGRPHHVAAEHDHVVAVVDGADGAHLVGDHRHQVQRAAGSASTARQDADQLLDLRRRRPPRRCGPGGSARSRRGSRASSSSRRPPASRCRPRAGTTAAADAGRQAAEGLLLARRTTRTLLRSTSTWTVKSGLDHARGQLAAPAHGGAHDGVDLQTVSGKLRSLRCVSILKLRALPTSRRQLAAALAQLRQARLVPVARSSASSASSSARGSSMAGEIHCRPKTRCSLVSPRRRSATRRPGGPASGSRRA